MRRGEIEGKGSRGNEGKTKADLVSQESRGVEELRVGEKISRRDEELDEMVDV